MVHSCRGGKMAGKKVNGTALEAFLKLLCVVLSGLGLESLCMYVLMRDEALQERITALRFTSPVVPIPVTSSFDSVYQPIAWHC